LGRWQVGVWQWCNNRLNQQSNVFCLRFKRWQFQGFEDAKCVLIETVITELRDARPAVQKAQRASRRTS